MKLIERKDIDTEKWNDRISRDPIQNIFSYTWYLDAVAENWCALVDDADYSTILPIAYTKKIGVERMYQAPFTREYDIFGNGFSWEDALQLLSERFKGIDFRIEDGNLLPNAEERNHQLIPLNAATEGLFRTNCRRLIKKADKNYNYKEAENPSVLLDLFKKHVAHKIDSINDNDLVVLEKLMNSATANNQGKLYLAYDVNNVPVSGAFILIDTKKITYLKGAASESAKKNGAMFGMINYIIQTYSNSHEILDFGGSDIESVATFYKKFGAINRKYYHYTIDKTPFWFKLLKKLKTN